MCGTVGSTVVETFTTIPIPLGELSIATGFKWNSADYTGETPEIAPAYVKATWGDQYGDSKFPTKKSANEFVAHPAMISQLLCGRIYTGMFPRYGHQLPLKLT